MSIKTLINGQTIRLDNHNRGHEISTDGLHLHKVMNNNKFNHAEVLISFDDVKEIEFRDRAGIKKNNPKLINEIQQAYALKRTREDFIRSFKDSLSNLLKGSQALTEDQRKQYIEKATSIIVKHFGPDYDVSYIQPTQKKNEYIAKFQSRSQSIFVKTDLEDQSLCLGRTRRHVMDFDK